jgi:hypothetical protein
MPVDFIMAAGENQGVSVQKANRNPQKRRADDLAEVLNNS